MSNNHPDPNTDLSGDDNFNKDIQDINDGKIDPKAYYQLQQSMLNDVHSQMRDIIQQIAVEKGRLQKFQNTYFEKLNEIQQIIELNDPVVGENDNDSWDDDSTGDDSWGTDDIIWNHELTEESKEKPPKSPNKEKNKDQTKKKEIE
ncbi:hypothetical protein QTN25_010573 [Entamoeba marina]